MRRFKKGKTSIIVQRSVSKKDLLLLLDIPINENIISETI